MQLKLLQKTLDAKFRWMYPRSISTAQMWDSKIAHKELKFQFTLPACTRLRPSIGSTKPCIPAPPSLFVFREQQIWTGKTWYSWKRIAKEQQYRCYKNYQVGLACDHQQAAPLASLFPHHFETTTLSPLWTALLLHAAAKPARCTDVTQLQTHLSGMIGQIKTLKGNIKKSYENVISKTALLEETRKTRSPRSKDKS